MYDENKPDEMPEEQDTQTQASTDEASVPDQSSSTINDDGSSDDFDMSKPGTEPEQPESIADDLKAETPATPEPVANSADDFDMSYDDTGPDRPLDVRLSELNLSAEDSTQDVEIIFEGDLSSSDEKAPATFIFTAKDDGEGDSESAEELNIVTEDETTPVSVLREEDLALLDNIQEKTDASTDDSEGDSEDDDEIVIRDFLNEDDGEAPGTPDYLKPPEPEWKLVARQLREDREAKQREMIEKRRQEDERVISGRKERMEKLEQQREDQETEFRADWERRQQEKKQAVNDMMQRIRDERERKEQERAATDQQVTGRKLTYPKPSERKPYPKPSEIKRMEREQPLKDSESDIMETTKITPLKKTKPGDMESRLSRLSKPDQPEPATDDPQDSPTDNPEAE